MGKYRNPM